MTKKHNKEKFVAIVPVREFDSILPGKNSLPFGSSDLLTHKLRQLKETSRIDKIIVSTDSKNFEEISISEGVEVNKRPKKYASQDANFNEFVKYIASKYKDTQIVWAPVTTPLIDSKDYGTAIKEYSEAIKKEYDSLITVNKVKRYLLDENGPLNFRYDIGQRSQNALPVLYEYVNGISIAPSNSIYDWGYNWGKIPFKLILPVMKQIDICDQEDYKFARFLNGDFN